MTPDVVFVGLLAACLVPSVGLLAGWNLVRGLI